MQTSKASSSAQNEAATSSDQVFTYQVCTSSECAHAEFAVFAPDPSSACHLVVECGIPGL